VGKKKLNPHHTVENLPFSIESKTMMTKFKFQRKERKKSENREQKYNKFKFKTIAIYLSGLEYTG